MVSLKKVTNADTGNADIVGGDDWDNMADWANEQVHPVSHIVYKSGSNFKAFNTDAGTATSGTDVYTIISNLLSGLASQSSVNIKIRAGFYSLTGTLQPPSYCQIEGESQFGLTQLRPSGDFPAIEITGTKTNITLQNLYLSHFQSGYTSSVLRLKPTAAGAVAYNNFNGLFFNDFNLYATGANAIEMDCTTGSVYNNTFSFCQFSGFENGIFANIGAAVDSTHFVNKNDFLRCSFNSPKRILKVTAVSNGAFDNNSFIRCYMQGYAGTLCGWDYETGNSGRALYANHTNCFIDDLPGSTKYALINSGTQLHLSGCYPAWKVAGAGTQVTTEDFYTVRRGTSTQSGNGSTKVFNIAHNLQAAPSFRTVVPGSSDALGSYYVTSDATNVIVTYAVAPPTGTNNLVFNWEAKVF